MSHLNPDYEPVGLAVDQSLSTPRPSLSPGRSKERLVPASTDQLPAKSFTDAQHPKWKRALRQTFIGVGQLTIWIALYFVFRYCYWHSESPNCIDDSYTIFSIDSMYGNHTLSQVRLIDISFNLVAGRGMQAGLGFVSYRVITDVLMRMMELTPVSFELFSALTFQLSSVTTIWPIVKAFLRLPGWRPKFIMGWILFSAVFLLAFPTLMDTMTGYVQLQDYFVAYNDDARFPWSEVNNFNQTQLDDFKKLHGGGDQQIFCNPEKYSGYQWGFASTWVLINLAVLGLWMLGTYSVWMDAQHKSELRRKGRTMNAYRAVADMAEAMTEVLGPNTAPYSGQELEKALKESNARVMYVADVDEVTGLGKVGLRSRKRGEMGKLSWDVVYGEERE